MKSARNCVLLVIVALAAVLAGIQAPASADESNLRDRAGIPTSMSGTYVRKGELLVYPFFEYYWDNNTEYKPSELGYGLEQDFHNAKFRASEGILFGSYGVTDRIAVEMEASVIKARQQKDPADPSGVPPVIEESGTGDVEGQLHVRLLDETDHHPEVTAYFEAVSPQQRDKVLIGTPDWEFALGAHVIRGYLWGTMTVRAAASYKLEDKTLDMGEYAVEYLRTLSSQWKVYTGVEGEQDDVALIVEGQWHFSPRAYLKLNNGFGITPKATDLAPEVGVMFSFGGR